MPNPLFSSRVRESGGDGYNGEPPAVLECIIERVTFHNEENGYSVVKVTEQAEKGKAKKGRAKDDVITVLGSFTNPVVGESLRCHGQWIKHPQYGPQFKMDRYETLRPATAAAIEKYLGSGMVKGIGPVMAKRIVEKFGDTALDIIEETPEKLTKVSGIGEKRIALIKAAWDEQREVRAIMLFLQGHGVTPTYAVKIYRTYKERSIEVVEKNPYQLATDIWGIGFKSADKIAQNIGIAPDAPERLEAGLVYVLNQEMEGGGHCFLMEDDLVKKSCEILGAEIAPVERALQSLVDRELLVAETVDFMGTRDTAIYTPSIFTTEKAVADRINTLLNSPWRSRPKPDEIDRAMEDVKGYDILSEEQKQAVRRALSEPILILTGGPGTGKTTTTRAIVSAFDNLGRRLQLASPTGRAAKRAAEVTGKEAKTIHRLLAFDPEKKGFKHGPGEPLELDVLIIDESSMLDLVLTHHTLRAVPDGAQVIFVGDVDQLPSVGPGNVLGDLIDSGRVPVAKLTQVFRQAAQSKIITGAHAINRGKIPDLPPPSAIQSEGADCVFLEVEESDEIPAKIAGVVAKSLPKLGFSRDEITVLVPMQRGTVGARNLNEVLQGVMNPPRPDKAEYRRGPVAFRVGDRVMQRVNNYDKNVFNGDVGNIAEIDSENQTVTIVYPEGPIEYDFVDMDQLVHASCVSIHKCLRAGERVRTQDRGLVPIENLVAGDVIHTGDGSQRKVAASFAIGQKPVVRATTRSGYCIDVSEEHPLLVTAGTAAPEWVTARDLRPGYFACLSREVVNTSNPVELPPSPVLPGRPNAPRLSLPGVLDEDLCWLLGALVGDGSYRDRKDGTVDFTNQDPEVLERVQRIMERYGLRVCRYTHPARNAARLYVVSRAFRQWLFALGLDFSLAPTKRVPEPVFSASASCRAAFLRGLFDTDGSAGKGTCRLCRLVTASPQLAREAQQMLLSLGIVSQRSSSGPNAYCVAVSGTSLLPFAQRVGFTVCTKQARLTGLLELSASGNGKTNVDIVPYGKQLAEEAQTLLSSCRPAGGNREWPDGGAAIGRMLSELLREQYRLSYAHLNRLITYMERIGIEAPARLREAQDRHFFFDPIVSVEPTGEIDEMYDIEVEEIHSFASASGFVCHNSQGSEYPACVIALHTQHYMMLQRNLVYTALTRAKKLAVFVGSKRAIAMAVRNRNVVPRNTRLAQRLQKLVDDLHTKAGPREDGGAGNPAARDLSAPPMPGRLF